MTPKRKTTPDFSASVPENKKQNQFVQHFNLTQNVVDKFKGFSKEKIKSILQSNAFPYAVCVENWEYDFNIATCIRNANAFNARKIFYVGAKKIDRRGAIGTYNYTDVEWLETIDDLLKLKETYTFVGVDNIKNAKQMNDYQWKENTLLIFGSESFGLTPDMIKLCDELVYIEMFGSVRSLNCGTASGIVMNDFVSKISKKNIGRLVND